MDHTFFGDEKYKVEVWVTLNGAKVTAVHDPKNPENKGRFQVTESVEEDEVVLTGKSREHSRGNSKNFSKGFKKGVRFGSWRMEVGIFTSR